MNVMMMLGKDEKAENKKEGVKQAAKSTGEHDQLKNTRRVKPIQLHTMFKAFDEDS